MERKNDCEDSYVHMLGDHFLADLRQRIYDYDGI